MSSTFLQTLHEAMIAKLDKSCATNYSMMLLWASLANAIPVSTIFTQNVQADIPVNIRIYLECEGRIEKSVLRIPFWHHEACRVMTSCDPDGQVFLSYSHTNNGFFFLPTTVLLLKISFQKSLNTLRYNFTL